MRLKRPLALSAALFLLCLVLAPSAVTATPEARRKLVERSIQPEILASDSRGERLAQRMRALDAPGLAVAVIDNFEIDWVEAYGKAAPDGSKLTPEMLHNAGSVSKTVCALTAMRLVDMGKLALDTPINDYLRTWKLPENEFTKETPVTLRHLLSHSGGTTVHGFPGYGPSDALPTISQLLDGEAPANSGAVRVNQAPGTSYRYSGGGTTIVQLAIQDITGRPFHEVAKELVLDPLGMKRTTYVQPVDGVEIGPRAMGFASNPGFSGTIVFTATGAAGLWSTAEDLARMLIGVMKSVRGDEDALLKQESAEQMLTVVAGDAGLGFFIGDHDGARSFGHGGDNTGFHAQVWALDGSGQGAVTLVNSDAGRPLQMEFLRAVADVYDWPENAWEPRRVEVGKLDRKLAKAAAGRYRFGAEDVVTVARKGDTLTYRECYWGERVAEMLPLANGNFMLTSGRNEFGFPAELEFERDAKGGVTAMRLAGSTYYVLPRMKPEERTSLEHVEAGRYDQAIAAWEKLNDQSSGLMNYSARQVPFDAKDERDAALKMRAYTAKQFPLSERPQMMYAEGLERAGKETEAAKIREQFAQRKARVEAIATQLAEGPLDEGLSAFDRLAKEVGTNAAYRWLIDQAWDAEDVERATKLARHAIRKLPKSADAAEALARALYRSGDRSGAIESIERALKLAPYLDDIAVGRMWKRDLWKGEEVKLSAEQMARYVGVYGRRHIVMEDGALAYYRDSNAPRKLIPVGEHRFMMREVDNFQMEIVLDDNGAPTKIVGHYLGGRQDQSLRDPRAD